MLSEASSGTSAWSWIDGTRLHNVSLLIALSRQFTVFPFTTLYPSAVCGFKAIKWEWDRFEENGRKVKQKPAICICHSPRVLNTIQVARPCWVTMTVSMRQLSSSGQEKQDNQQCLYMAYGTLFACSEQSK